MKVGDIVKNENGLGYVIGATYGNQVYFLERTDGGATWSSSTNGFDVIDTTGDMTIEVKDHTVIVTRGEEIGIATCAPEDDFNLLYGIALAASRLAKPWPSDGDTYYYVDGLSKPYNVKFENSRFDKTLVLNGNVFRTREEAEAVAEEIKAVFAKHKQMAIK